MALGPLLPSSVLVVPCFLVGVGLLAVPPALAPVALQQVCPNEFRGQVFAIYLLIASIFGYAVGPLLTACMTDLVLHNEAQLNLSLGAMGALFLPVAAVLFGLSMRGDSTSLTRTGVAKRQLGRRRPR
jgi:MFS family permease